MRREISGQIISVHVILIMLISVLPLSMIPGGVMQNASASSSWLQTTKSDFSGGDTANVSISSSGDMTIGLKIKSVKDQYQKSSSGDLYTSTNLLSGIETISIDHFNVSANIPSNYIVKVQFSKNNKFWYNAGGTKRSWDTLTNGSNYLSLSKLSWKGSSFYYKLSFSPSEPSEDLKLDIYLSYRHYPSPIAYTSEAYDAGKFATWHKLFWNATQPTGTSVKFQLRSGTATELLTSADFVGPDGKTTSYYLSSGMNIWSGHDHDRWMQYRAFFSTNSQSSNPTLQDVTITYDAFSGIPKLESPTYALHTTDNTPQFSWSFIVDNYTQCGFQMLLDDDPGFISPIHDSGARTSSAKKWQFMDGSSPKIIGDGDWYWKVRSKDGDNIWSPYSTGSKLKIDTTAPISNVTHPGNNSGFNSISKISGTASDHVKGSGVKRVELQIERLDNLNTWNGNSWDEYRNWLVADGTTSWSYNISNSAFKSNLIHRCISRAIDNLNISEIPGGYNYFSIDTVNPSIKITSPKSGNYRGGPDAITGLASDGNGSGIKSVKVCITADFGYDPVWNGDKWIQTYTCIWLSVKGTTNWSYSLSNLDYYTGSYTIMARATDKAGNTNDAFVSFYLDNSPPGITLWDETYGEWLKNLNKVQGESWDNPECGVRKIEVNITIENNYYFYYPRVWCPQGQWINYTSDLIFPQDFEGKGSITATAWDAADNWKSASIDIKIDTKPPTSNTIFPANHSIVNNVSAIKGTAIDGGAGVYEVFMCLKNVTDNTSYIRYLDKWFPGDAWYWADGRANWTYDTSKVTWTKGKYEVYTLARDLAKRFNSQDLLGVSSNNESVPRWSTFYVGDVDPQLSLNINDWNGFTRSRSVSIKLDGNGTQGMFEKMAFSEDNTSWSSWENFSSSKNYQLSAGDGEKTVFARVKDKNGNLSYANDSIVLDSKAPENVSVVINNNAIYTKNDLVTLTIGASDKLSGIASMTFSDDDTNWTGYYGFKTSESHRIPTGDSKKTVYIRVYDKAGNWAGANDMIYLDTTPPGNLSILINNNAVKTNSTTVQLSLNGSDGLSGLGTMAFSDDGITWSSSEAFKTNKTYQLPAGDGNKTMYYRVWDNIGNGADPVSDSIILNTTVDPPPNGNGSSDGNNTGNNTGKGKRNVRPPGNNGNKPTGNNKTKKSGRHDEQRQTKGSTPPMESFDLGDVQYENYNDLRDDRLPILDELINGEKTKVTLVIFDKLFLSAPFNSRCRACMADPRVAVVMGTQ